MFHPIAVSCGKRCRLFYLTPGEYKPSEVLYFSHLFYLGKIMIENIFRFNVIASVFGLLLVLWFNNFRKIGLTFTGASLLGIILQKAEIVPGLLLLLIGLYFWYLGITKRDENE
jgi:hypothetical protein